MSEHRHEGPDGVDELQVESHEQVAPGEPTAHVGAVADGEVTEAADPEARTEDVADEGPAPAPGAASATPAPETGDLVIDAALRDLAEAPEDDLDAQVERGEQVQRTLQGRLSDLGG
ncbi:hypothetical protein LL946_15600 [Knoellia locipacati]|uniref:hypothetical protein n=1 Tax=Knoellia locipacati TaxID=882824 RepID=UPI00384B8C88